MNSKLLEQKTEKHEIQMLMNEWKNLFQTRGSYKTVLGD